MAVLNHFKHQNDKFSRASRDFTKLDTRAHFVNICTLKLQNVCIPLIQFWIDVPDEPRDVMVLAEGVNISISTHNL